LIRFYEVIILRTPGPISLNTRRSECFCASLFPFTPREVESLQKHSWQQEGNAFWGKPYRVSFYLWRRSPRWFRSVFSRSVAAKGLKTSVRNRLARYAGREDIYNREYYTYVDAEASRSAPAIVQSVIAHVAPRSIADLGCGTGALLAEFRAQAVEGTGLEYSQAALEKCRERGLNVRRWNIEEQRQPQFGPFDVVTCFEVAEHLSPACADPLVALLTALGPVVIFTRPLPAREEERITSTNSRMNTGSRSSSRRDIASIASSPSSGVSDGSRPTSPPSMPPTLWSSRVSVLAEHLR
jgi:SAM-dependent methyltransferase